MDLFIHIYKKNYIKKFNRKKNLSFETACGIFSFVVILLSFILSIFNFDIDKDFIEIITSSSCLVFIIIIMITDFWKKRKKNNSVIYNTYNNNIKVLKLTFEERGLQWSKDNLTLLLSECNDKLNYKNQNFETFKNISAITIIPLLLTITINLIDNFNTINQKIGILFIALLMIFMSFIICTILYNIIHKDNFYYQSIKNTIFDFRLSSEYEEME